MQAAGLALLGLLMLSSAAHSSGNPEQGWDAQQQQAF